MQPSNLAHRRPQVVQNDEVNHNHNNNSNSNNNYDAYHGVVVIFFFGAR